MKNVASLKSNSTNSPKTPGGISKSLLTPCRRLGLSRNWRKSGPSPFISPLSSCSSDTKEDKHTRKRKEREDKTIEENTDCVNNDENVGDADIHKTPTRNVLPRKKKSKTLLTSINKSQEDIITEAQVINNNISTEEHEESVEETSSIDSVNNENIEVVSTPIRTKSKQKKTNSLKSKPKSSISEVKVKPEEPINTPAVEQNDMKEIYIVKEKSPNDLKKECIVVIQRKIFKNVKTDETDRKDDKNEILIDSDSDEAPLINLHKQKSKQPIDDENDFVDNKLIKNKTKLSTKSPKNKLKTKPPKTNTEKVSQEQKPSSQNCFDDDDDDFDDKRTIIIKKTYEKVSKPAKAKSTGSITQRDIDNLKQRIEAKKKLLIAQSITPDTEELRNLIKRWQKGCQDALMELLELMRNKFPDKENMDYSEMLKTLKIPASLVGYDSDNDCFNSPDDATIILGQLKDI